MLNGIEPDASKTQLFANPLTPFEHVISDLWLRKVDIGEHPGLTLAATGAAPAVMRLDDLAERLIVHEHHGRGRPTTEPEVERLRRRADRALNPIP